MRGSDRPQATMLTLVNPEQRVPASHPIRPIKQLAEVVLKELSPLFEQMYSEVGRPSIPPERLLKASLLMAMIDLRVGQAGGRAECEQGPAMLHEVRAARRITAANDKGYDTAGFVAGCRALNVTPHVAHNERRRGGSALDPRTTGWPGYALSQPVRKRVEEIFG